MSILRSTSSSRGSVIVEFLNIPEGPEHESFYHAYGKFVSAWNAFEGHLHHSFHLATGLEWILSQEIFFSARTYSGRADMLKAALGSPLVTNDIAAFFTTAIKVGTRYYGERNRVVHGVTAISLDKGLTPKVAPVIFPSSGIPSATDATFTENLRNGWHNYSLLSHLVFIVNYWIQEVADGNKSLDPTTPQRCRELALQLPTFAMDAKATLTKAMPLISWSPDHGLKWVG